MSQNGLSIRVMTREDLELAVEWAAREGWNPGWQDADCFYAADPTGFLGGWLGSELVACISAVKYGATFGFLGFYIVHPQYRGQGFGLHIWDTALKSLQGRVIGLDGVVAQQENYRRSGFELAYRNVRYQGTGSSNSTGVDLNLNSAPQASVTSEIEPLASFSFAEVVDYDRRMFPEDRTQFLQGWIEQPNSIAMGVRQHSKLVGYGVMRRCREGYKIGPLFADDVELAERLFRAFRSQVDPKTPLFLDAPTSNPAAIAMLERHGWKVVFETARMYLGPAPVTPLDRCFGVTTFELG